MEEINRRLRVKYTAFRVRGLPGEPGTFAVYTKAPPPLGELRMVGEAFPVRADGRFDSKALPQEARLVTRRNLQRQRMMGKTDQPATA